MSKEFRVISSTGEVKSGATRVVLPEDKLRHFRNITGSVVKEAINVWADMWNELEGSVAHGCMVSAEAEEGFKPGCGWPEFLEKMWLLKHYLDYLKRYCDEK